MTQKAVAKFKRKLTSGFKITYIRNLVNFHARSRKSENFHFDRILLFKVCKDLDEKVQMSYVSWHWRLMQSLKKKIVLALKFTEFLMSFLEPKLSWLLVPKMTQGIWWILMQAVASLRIFTLMCYFCQ